MDTGYRASRHSAGQVRTRVFSSEANDLIPAGPCSIEFAGNLGATNGKGGGRRDKLTAAQVDSGRRAVVRLRLGRPQTAY